MGSGPLSRSGGEVFFFFFFLFRPIPLSLPVPCRDEIYSTSPFLWGQSTVNSSLDSLNCCTWSLSYKVRFLLSPCHRVPSVLKSYWVPSQVSRTPTSPHSAFLLPFQCTSRPRSRTTIHEKPWGGKFWPHRSPSTYRCFDPEPLFRKGLIQTHSLRHTIVSRGPKRKRRGQRTTILQLDRFR